MLRFLLVTVALAMAMAGCGGDDEPDAPAAFETFAEACDAIAECREPRVDTRQPRETIFWVLVVRGANGDISFDGIEEVEVFAGAGVPIGPLSGSHVLVGLDASGAAVDSQAIRFPDRVDLEALDGKTPSNANYPG